MQGNLKIEINRMVDEVMGIDITKLDVETKFNTISEWDSFNNLMLISRLQDYFKVEFTALEIENTQKLKDLYSLVEKKSLKV